MNEIHTQEAKERLVRDSENKLLSKFFKNYGNAKLIESKADLQQVDGVSTSDYVFDGTITISAHVGTKSISIPLSVKANEVELPEDKELDAVLETAEEIKEAESDDAAIQIAEAFPVKANLAEFRITDDGSDFLKIYHVALDSGKELGIISKDEYNSLPDKESFLKDVLTDQMKTSFLENHYELSFEGSFVEPKIELRAAEEIVTAADFEEKLPEPVVEEIVEESKDENDLFLAHQADSYNQSLQFESQKVEANIRRLATQVSNDVVSYLRSLKYDSVKVLTVDQTDASTFSVTASLIDSVGEKVVTLNIPVRDEVFSLPKKEVVAELVSKTMDLQTKIAEEIALDTINSMKLIDDIEVETEQNIEAIISDDKIKIIAGGEVGGVQFIGPVDVLNIDKHTLASYGITEDMEVGDVVYADGFHWKLTSKDQNNLSKEADSGSIWTFTKVPPTDKKPENEIVA